MMTAVNVVTLLYHSTYDDKDTNEFYDINVSLLKDHVKAVRRQGLECITATDLVESTKECTKCCDKLLLTFDDGKRDHYEFVVPILEEHSVRATFFVNPGRVGKAEYLDWSQLREMDQRGMSIQSHGLTHRHLHQLPAGEIDRELRESKSEIEQQIGRRVEFLSFPGGFYTKEVVASAWDYGFHGVFTSDPGFDRICRPVRSALLHRYNMTRFTTSEEVIRLLQREWSLRLRLQMLHGIKTGVRKVLGTSAYHWGWTKIRKFVR
jgi:peptidoglycan/xylan/chitin deacetylase (PgdA/CDA1 family)